MSLITNQDWYCSNCGQTRTFYHVPDREITQAEKVHFDIQEGDKLCKCFRCKHVLVIKAKPPLGLV